MLAEVPFHVERLLLIPVIMLLGLGIATWFAPYALARIRWPMQEHHIPVRLRLMVRSLGVQCFFVEAFPGDDYAFSAFLGWRRVIVVSHVFHHHAPEAAVEFAIAHELGHHYHGHPFSRFLIRWLWLDCTRWGRRWIERQENDANAFAEQLTDLPRSVLWSVGVPKTAAGGSGQSEDLEEKRA